MKRITISDSLGLEEGEKLGVQTQFPANEGRWIRLFRDEAMAEKREEVL